MKRPSVSRRKSMMETFGERIARIIVDEEMKLVGYIRLNKDTEARLEAYLKEPELHQRFWTTQRHCVESRMKRFPVPSTSLCRSTTTTSFALRACGQSVPRCLAIPGQHCAEQLVHLP